MRFRLTYLLLSAVLFAGCADKSRCKRVCQKEARCAEQSERALPFDPSECVEQCKELERSSAGKQAIEAHASCVEATEDCAAVLRCP